MIRIITSLFAFILILPYSQGQNSFSLKEAIHYAQNNSSAIQMERLKIADAEGQIDEYTSIGIPKINGKAGYTHYFDIPTSILPDFISPSVYNVLFDEGLLERRDLETAGGIPAQFGTENIVDVGVDLQTLILDGSYFVGLRAQHLYRDLVAKRYDEVVYNARESISLAYLTVLNIGENQELLDRNISNLEKLYNETQAIYENGFAEKLDADRLRLSLQNLKSERQNLERLKDVAVFALKYNMGYPVDDEIVLTDKFDDHVGQALVEDLSQFEDISFEDRVEYASLETAVELQDLNVKRLKMGYLPSLSGFASYGAQLQRNDLFDGNENEWFKTSLVGVNLNVPIFDGLQRHAQIQRAKISRENTLLQKSLFEQTVMLQVNSTYLDYINAREKVTNSSDNMALAQEIYDVTQIKYREGVGSSLEVTQAESELYRSQSNHSAALFDLVNAAIKLKAAKGHL